MIGQSDHEAQKENIKITIDENITLNKTNNSTQVKGSQVVSHTYTFEKNFTKKIRCEVDSVMTTVETSMHDPVLTAIENLVVPTVELSIKSVNTSSARSLDVVVLEPDERNFSGIVEGLQLIVSNRIVSYTDLKGNDETRGSIFTEDDGLLVKGIGF